MKIHSNILVPGNKMCCIFAALRRSKRRVRAVTTTELPFLVLKEFPSNQENDPFIMKSSSDEMSSNAISAMHQERWKTLFDQMEKALSEEEKQLVRIRGSIPFHIMGPSK